LTYFTKLPPDQLRKLQTKSQKVIHERHLQKCKKAVTLYNKYHDIDVVAEKLNVKRRQAFRLVAKGKTL